MEHVETQPGSGGLGRRQLFVAAGSAFGLAALLAACGVDDQPPARVGYEPTGASLPKETITNAVLLRTSASLERSIIAVYEQALASADLLDASHQELFTRLLADHQAAAKDFDAATTSAGDEPWPCSNPRFDSALITPALQRITTGIPARKIPASDDPKRDVLNLVHALESVSSASYQQMVGTLTESAFRVTSLTESVHAARRAALLAMTINTARPGGYVTATDAANAGAPMPTTTTVATTVAPDAGPPKTEIPLPVALPGQFGQLGSIQLVVGEGDENGVRLKSVVDTPSDNSYIYPDTAKSC